MAVAPRPTPGDPKSVLIADAEALLNYASERHLLTGDTADATQAIQSNLTAPLSKAIGDYQSAGADAEFEKRNLVLFYYSALTKLTAPVTGRSVRCSVGHKAYSSWPVYVTFGMLAIAVVLEATALLYPANGAPPPLLDFLRPLAWGALGSCIYLLKSISDMVSDFEFDERLLKGFATRVVIGAVLGMVVVKLFKIDTGTQSLTPSAVAFLCGVGAKVIYGALENIIEALAQRLTYSAFKKSDQDSAGTAPAMPTPPPTQVVPANASGANAPAAITGGQPFSIMVAVKNQLAAQGLNPGPLDSNPNSRTVEAIQAFIARVTGQQATETQVRGVDPLMLLRWLRAGKVPDDWQQQIAQGQSAPAAGDPADAINREMLDLLKRQGIGSGAPAAANADALERLADDGVAVLVARDGALAKLSFTAILDTLRQRAASG